MAVTFKTYDTIRAAYVASLSGALARVKDTREIALLGAIVSGFSALVSGGYVDLAELRDSFYTSRARGQDFIRRVFDYGMILNQGSLGSGKVMGILASGTQSVPAGTILVSSSGIAVRTLTTTTVTSPGTALDTAAIEVGLAGNLPLGTLLTTSAAVLAPMTFRVGTSLVAGVPTGSNLTGGSNPETVEEGRARWPSFLKSLRGTTVAAVRQGLIQTAGVSNLVLENAVPAGGYMRISVLADEGNNISTVLRAAIAATMLTCAPAGMAYRLKPLKTKSVDIVVKAYTTDLALSPAVIKTDVAAAITALTATLVPGQSLYRAQIQRAGFLSYLSNFEVMVPVSDDPLLPTDVLQVGAIDVQVVYA